MTERKGTFKVEFLKNIEAECQQNWDELRIFEEDAPDDESKGTPEEKWDFESPLSCCEHQVVVQVHGDLPLPLHERAAAPGSHLHHLQVWVCCWIPEAQGQKMPLSFWLPRHWDANQGQKWGFQMVVTWNPPDCRPVLTRLPERCRILETPQFFLLMRRSRLWKKKARWKFISSYAKSITFCIITPQMFPGDNQGQVEGKEE